MISASAIPTSKALSGVPEVTNVSFDMRRLEVQVLAPHADEPDFRAAAYCLFDTCVGFRVLDEGDILEFWTLEPRPSGWLWRIHSGGWFDHEKQRDGFLSSSPAGPDWPIPSEFLILGIEYCVSVLAYREPTVWIAEPFAG